MSMKYSGSKEINEVIKRLLRSNWTFYHGRKHGRLLPPNSKVFLTVATTPSDRNSIKSFSRDLKRIAKEIPCS
jgi:hypothetical protein